jgi:plasmid stabilization system protein ParE
VRRIFWTEQARADLAAIHAYIEQDSAHYASVTIRQLIAAVDQLATSAESGRAVPEFDDAQVHEIVRRAYRIVYRLVGREQVHVLTVHHGRRQLPPQL